MTGVAVGPISQAKPIMTFSIRLLVVAFVLSTVSLAAWADDGEYPILAEDGSLVANHRIPAELENSIEKMQDVVVAAHPNGKVTLYEFYDLNCPYCRQASADIDELVKSDPQLRLVLVPFAVLGIPSILAARVEYAVARLATPAKFYEFHRLVYQGRGVVDAQRAFAAAKQTGLDAKKVLAVANEQTFAEVMTAHVHLGDALQIQATPGFVIKGVVIVGYPGKAALTKVIASAERCGKVVCEAEK
jgi:protein-disulfide isomerase